MGYCRRVVERIAIGAAKLDHATIVDMARQLTVAGCPTVLWWSGARLLESRTFSGLADLAGAVVVASSARSTVTACSGCQPGRSSSVRRTPARIPASGSSSSTGASEPFTRTAPAAASAQAAARGQASGAGQVLDRTGARTYAGLSLAGLARAGGGFLLYFGQPGTKTKSART